MEHIFSPIPNTTPRKIVLTGTTRYIQRYPWSDYASIEDIPCRREIAIAKEATDEEILQTVSSTTGRPIDDLPIFTVEEPSGDVRVYVDNKWDYILRYD